MNDKNEHSDGKFFFGFFLGGLLGAMTVFFLGTKEGKKAGKMLGDKGRELIGDLEDRVGDLQERGKELLAQGEDLKEDLKERLMEKKDDFTQEAITRIDKTLESVESLQQKGMETTANLRKSFRNIPKKTQSETS